MGDRTNDGSGVLFSNHIPNIRKAVENCKQTLEAEFKSFRIQIHTPEVQEFGSIDENIFNLIQFAELGILDVSANSPSVMYELTLMHALGIPIIPMHLKAKIVENKIPFYLTHDYSALVSNYRVKTLAKELLPKIRAAIQTDNLGADHKNNPLTRYFGLPLIDASATTGLATGYFHNYIQHIIKQVNSVFGKVEGLKSIVILKPSSLDEVGELKDRLLLQLKKIGIENEKVDRDDGKIYEDVDHIRGPMIIFKAGDYLYDTPAPLLAQKSSPMHLKVSKLLSGAEGPNKVAIKERLERLQKNMIHQFFSALEEMSRTNPGSNPNRLEFKTVPEFVEMLERDQKEK